jgi:hypothetical protein
MQKGPIGGIEVTLYEGHIVHWEIREQMTETDVEIIIQKAKEKFPEARPRIISDNGRSSSPRTSRSSSGCPA